MTTPLLSRCLLLASFLFVLRSPAQDRFIVKGEILDGETKEPVPSVNVTVRGKKLGTMTDTAGYFRLELPIGEPCLLVFSHIAYQKVTREVSPDKPSEAEFRIYLVQEPVKLLEFVVTGTKQFAITKAAEQRATWRLGAAEFEQLGEEEMEKAMVYLLPSVVKELWFRMTDESYDFTLYVNGKWKESIFLNEIDPFNVRRVLVWEAPGKFVPIDIFPLGLPLRRGSRYVVLVETW